MKSYNFFADYYDKLTDNVDYNAICERFCEIFSQYGNKGNIILDLACGTGNLSFLLADKGFDVIATDSSEQMLSKAMNKAVKFGNPMFLCQSMQNLDLFGTIDAAVCTLDSINHLITKKDVEKAFERVSLFLNPNGLFIFDVNTLYKHSKVLGNNAFVYDFEDVYCVWQNEFNKENGSVDISLDFFCECEDGLYQRQSENFSEMYYDDEFITGLCEKYSMTVLQRFDDFTQNEVSEKSQRVLYVCRKD